MQQHLEQGHKQLPLVVPLLFYQGERRPYPYSLRWLDAFADAELAKRIYVNAFPLIDLTVIPDEEIKTHRRAALLELVQKHIRTRDMLEVARDIGLLFERWQVPLTQKRALLYYIAHTGNTSSPADFIARVAEPLSTDREEIMTIAQQLKQMGFEEGMQAGVIQGRAQGIEQGIEQGLERGIEQGIKTSARQIARQLLQNGMAREQVQQITQLSDEEMAQLTVSAG